MTTENIQMKVSGLMCSFCTMSLESALKRHDGVKSVLVNLVHGIVLVEADSTRISREDLARAVERLGYNVSSTEVQQYETDEAIFTLIRRRGAIGMVLALADLLLDPLNLLKIAPAPRSWFSFGVAVFILLWVGFPILRKTVLAIRGRVINANVLLSAGAWGSFIAGTLSLFDPRWPNFLPVAGWLMALHLFFGYFKLDTRKKAADAVRKLLSLQPARARVLRDGETLDLLTSEVLLHDIVLVRPGERIPLDGEVVDGMASVDESSFTGESVPASRTIGDSIIGGTLNLDGVLHVRVMKVGEESFLAQVVRLMMQVAERKPPLELAADRLMNYYGPVVFAVASMAWLAWLMTTGDPIAATLVLLTTIIMGYPCALGITTPMLAAIAGGKGISIGLLVKASEVFHQLSRVDTVVLDKTGTLTYGRPTVTDVIPFGVPAEELLGIAGSLESHSEHPLGQSIAFYADREGAPRMAVSEFRVSAGMGVSGRMGDALVAAGRPSFIAAATGDLPQFVKDSVDALSAEGKTVVLISRDREIIGGLALQDTPRRGGSRLIEQLRRRGIRPVMLTGDSPAVAQAIGSSLGIDAIHAELLPAEKVAAIEKLQIGGATVAMVGDGINDAPALAQADVGIAIGAGTDVAIESAGVILIGDHLEDVAGALDLGKAAYRTMTGNVVIAVLFNAGGMLLAVFGRVTPGAAIFVMIASIFAILLNTARIRWMRLERVADRASAHVAEVEFRVPNMVCDGCATKIRATLGGVTGVRAVRPNVAEKSVYVQYEPAAVDESSLIATLKRSGFAAVAA